MTTLNIVTLDGKTWSFDSIRDAYRWCGFARRAARRQSPEPSQIRDIHIRSPFIVFCELQPSFLGHSEEMPPIYLKGRIFDALDKGFVEWALEFKHVDSVIKMEYLLSFFGYPPPAP